MSFPVEIASPPAEVFGSSPIAAAVDCHDAVSASWVSADPQHSSLGMLERAGFAQVATIPAFWADDQQAAGYLCPLCGAGCICAAVILVLPLEGRASRG